MQTQSTPFTSLKQQESQREVDSSNLTQLNQKSKEEMKVHEEEEEKKKQQHDTKSKSHGIGASHHHHLTDAKRIHEKHQEYLQSKEILTKLPQLFHGYSSDEASKFLLFLAQLPIAMHRPRTIAIQQGFKAAGEIMTVQYDEKVPNIFKKMIENNISCVPVLDKQRRYIGMLDNLALVIHTLKSFNVIDEHAKAKDPAVIAMESIVPGVSATLAGANLKPNQSDTEMKIEQAAAAGASKEVHISSLSGSDLTVRLSDPIHVRGGNPGFTRQSLWTKERKPADKALFGDSWATQDFRETNALTVLRDVHETLWDISHSTVELGGTQVRTSHADILPSALVQGASTLFTVELLARHGLHHAPILDSERFVTGFVTESMIIWLVSQYKQQIPSFLQMSVKDMIPFLVPHRMMKVDEDAVAVEAFCSMVKERITGAAIVDKNGLLVDVLSTRDLRGIGRTGADFERLWMLVREFKETARQLYPDKTPSRVHYVTKNQKMVDVLNNLSDGNLHRCFVCETSSSSSSSNEESPRPIAVITQRDVMRILLVYLGLTLQGEIRVTTA